MSTLPLAGRPSTEVLDDLTARKELDIKWREGRAFSLAYFAGQDVASLAEEAYRRFSGDNGLNPAAFPSLRALNSDVVDVVKGWVGGSPAAAGFLTSGGTESLLMAVKAARDRLFVERGVTKPNVVLPTSAHAAFEKAAHYFGLENRRVAVTDDWRADTAEMANAIDDNTVLLVGSAPQYPQGVIDDIPTIADLAGQRGINCHVDACMGGVILSFLKRLGQDIPPWDLSVPGVSSVSIDLHKFGYTAKGASVMIYANKDLRSYQSFITDNWLGGTYGSSGVLGTKSAGPLAAAWAVMQYLGDEGYLRLAKLARNATLELAQGVKNNLDLKLRAEPESTLFSFGASNPAELNIFAVADELWRRGWYVDRQSPPDSLHCTVNAVHFDKVKSFIDDLNESVKIVKSKSATGESGSYGSVE